MSKTILALLCATFCITVPVVGQDVDLIKNATRLNGGIVVVLDSTDTKLITELAVKPAVQVQVLLQQDHAIDSLRQSIHAAGKYGQISINHYDGTSLPYVDNLVNMVVYDQPTVSQQELMRVLAPHGMLYAKTSHGYLRVVKSVPEGMDEWNQFLHNGANNGVSQDNVGPPQRMRWHNTPETGRSKALMPSVAGMVTAKGILYTIEDRASPEDINAPFEYQLVARDAFNGIELWKRPIHDWVKGGSTRGIKNVSSQLQRRLVTIGDYVYFPMEFDAPVSKIDGRSGEIVELLAGTASTREVAVEQNIMYGIQGAGYGLILEEAELQQRRGITPTPPRQVSLYAYDLQANKMLWQRPLNRGYIGASVCVNSNAIAYLAGNQLICLDKQTGTPQWTASVVASQKKPTPKNKKSKKPNLALGDMSVSGEDYNVHPTLILSADKALCAFDKEIAAYSLASGKKLWTSTNEASYMKSPELFVIGNIMWNRQLRGIDLDTGKVVKELKQKMLGPMSHDRCYRNRVTHQYYLNSASGGVDFVSLNGETENPNPWVRSTCGLSAMPANGMVYNGPFVCQCAIGSMLTGFNALYNESSTRFTVKHSPKTIHGPAFDRPLGQASNATDWPTYRQSPARSGISKTKLPANLATKWTVNIGPSPTAPVIANGHVYVASKDTHTLYCLDSATGEILWQFIAGGKIDSPPTYYKGLLLTGCRDGWVYCIDAKDGTLRWRFNGLPTKHLIADRGRIESAWPVNGSVLVEQGVAYFAAGRSSFLDGGVSLFGLNPKTGEVIHSNVVDGPFADDQTSFPETGPRQFRLSGFKSGIFSVADGKLFLRHQAFLPNLTPINIEDIQEPHLIASAGFLDSVPMHRSYWTVDVDLCYGGPMAVTGYGPLGDTTAYEAGEFFEVRGYTPGRNLVDRGVGLTPFNTHSVFAGKMTQAKKGDVWVSRRGKTIPEVGTWAKNWSVATPFAGHAISVCDNAVMVAGVPLAKGFLQQDTIDSFLGKKGGVMWMIDKTTGKRIQSFTLPAPPAWDGIAIANQTCVLSLKDGSVVGFAATD